METHEPEPLPLPDPTPASAELPPLAPGLPILGNTFQFLEDTTGLLLDSYRKLGPVYRVRALWLKYTVIAGTEAREFLRQGLDEQYLSRQVIFGEVGKQLGEADFVLGQSGEKHTRFRQLLSVAYSRQVASPFVPDFIQAVRDCIGKWRTGESYVAMDEIKRMAFEQYCRAMCGRSLWDHYHDCLMVTEYNMNVGGRVWPFFMYRAPWYVAARRRVLTLMWQMATTRRAAGPLPDQPPTIMDTLIRIADAQGNRLTDDEVVCYSMYGFAGSCSYMGRLVGFMLYEILKDPELTQALTEEVAQGFRQGLHSAADVRGLRLLRAVYHESLRFHPVSQGMPFYCERDFVYEGKLVRKGDTTVLSQVPMSFAECPFHEPHRFDPERCLEPRNEHRKEQSFHPFGIGNRTCTAMGLVELMAMTMVATLLHDLKLSMDPSDYQLRFEVKPLPAPDRRFRLRVGGLPDLGDPSTPSATLAEEAVLALFPGHDDPAVRSALETAVLQSFPPGETIIQEDDPAEDFYVIVRGSVEVTRRSGVASLHLATLTEGQFFGEIGLLQDVPRTATVVAGDRGTETLVLGREAFQRIVAASDLVSEEIASLVRKRVTAAHLVEALPGLRAADATRVLPEFEPQEFAPGTVILREGDPADHFYLLVEGEALVSKRSETGTDEAVAVLSPGRYFGELGLLYGTPRQATVSASLAGPVRVLTTDRAGFEKLLRETGGTRGDLAQAMLARAHQLTTRP